MINDWFYWHRQIIASNAKIFDLNNQIANLKLENAMLKGENKALTNLSVFRFSLEDVFRFHIL